MGDVLYRFFLSVGVGLGLIAGQSDPLIAAKVLRQDLAAGRAAAIVVEVQVDGAFSPGARELVESGSTVALKVTGRLVAKEGRSWEGAAIHSLAWDPRARLFKITFVGEDRVASVADLEAAVTLVSRFRGLRLCPAANLAEGGRVTIAASVGLIDAAGAWHDAPVLWNYVRPERSFTFASLTEVPF